MANPVLTQKTFTRFGEASHSESTMTIQGTVNKTAVLLGILVLSAAWAWKQYLLSGDSDAVLPWMFGGMIGGLIVALVTIFNKEWSMITAPAYALLEGLVIGGISCAAEEKFPGIVPQAVGLTFGVLFSILLAYKSELIRATEKFKLVIGAATGGIVLLYFATFILSFFGIRMSFINGNGYLSIGFSLFVVVIAAFNLVIDFDLIEQGAEAGAPSYMEWYGAFALMVTLIWLYLEILRLLAKLRSRD